MITIDHSKATERYVPDEGVYEVLIDEANLDTTKSGTEYIRLQLYIRDDVEQPEAGETFDFPIWKLRNPKPTDPEGYPAWRVQAISKAVQLPNGAVYNNLTEWLRAITNKALKVQVKHEMYNDNIQARVVQLYKTEAPEPPLERRGFIPVDDATLPF